ncbi:hypothetical protein EYW49_18810 [Siculibacillus lacustris]|uniref:Uncharacterized protein n=1 Tax=Siculibacillus lacustris TaxID=1549641 RepID=A0A4Q9VGS7_9HYPH|nr:hypothetical protein [Siculibacillus lacustris]TBW34052.1 hypothetical protein EYW49_18810 [Siculibacillus lacustris]
MPAPIVSRFAAALFVAAGLAAPPPAAADPGDPAGWSLVGDARGRGFLVWTPQADAPRRLMLGCLRDVDLVTVTARLPGLVADARPHRLELAAGSARHGFDGAVADEPDDGGVAFRAEIDVDAAGRRALEAGLRPILEGPGPLGLTVESVAATVPVAGLAAPARRFRAICFGPRK